MGGVYTGTDDFKPILHTTPDGHHEAWMTSHHAYTGQTIPRVSCVDVDAGTLCNGTTGRPTTWPKPLNTSAGPLGSGNTGNLATTEVVQSVVEGKLVRYPAVTTTPAQHQERQHQGDHRREQRHAGHGGHLVTPHRPHPHGNATSLIIRPEIPSLVASG